jgi:hypothetical protein
MEQPLYPREKGSQCPLECGHSQKGMQRTYYELVVISYNPEAVVLYTSRPNESSFPLCEG